MNYSTIKVEKKEGYVILTMDRPGDMNSLSRPMVAELMDSLTQIESDESVKAVVLTGGNYIFCAGMDLKEMSVLPDGDIDEYFSSMADFLKMVYSFKKPVIAAVGGMAFGGGFNLATVCDFIVASEAAIFGHPEIKFGLNPLFDPLRRIVGHFKAKEITMIGDPIGAKQAAKIGLVNEAAPPDEFMGKAEKMAKKISGKPAKAIEAVKRISDIVPRLDKSTALEYELETTALLFSREERRAYLKKFLEELKSRKKK